jgi:hypothetical protein
MGICLIKRFVLSGVVRWWNDGCHSLSDQMLLKCATVESLRFLKVQIGRKLVLRIRNDG